MCGRYVTPEIAAMERYWHIGRHNWLPLVLPGFNIAPTTQMPIITSGSIRRLRQVASRTRVSLPPDEQLPLAGGSQ